MFTIEKEIKENNMSRQLMSCGHAQNGRTVTNQPACVICNCETFSIIPDLTSRTAKCSMCELVVPSAMHLAFFKHEGDQDSFYCGCRG